MESFILIIVLLISLTGCAVKKPVVHEHVERIQGVIECIAIDGKSAVCQFDVKHTETDQ